MSFETDPFDHQHAVTQQALNPLFLELLQQVGAVAGEGVHGHSVSGHLYTRLSISKLDKSTQISNITLQCLQYNNDVMKITKTTQTNNINTFNPET